MKKDSKDSDSPQLIISKNANEVMAESVGALIDQSLEGQEQAYRQLLNLAFKSTLPTDWVDMGGKPYLQQSGATRVALRFGITIKFDRDNLGNPMFAREDFTDEKYGKGYVYTVTGKAILGSRVIEAIGTASTLDSFLGFEGKGENKKPMPIYESMQDAKKKAVTNFYNNAISQIIGLKGMTWDELAKYGIGRAGKPTVDYSAKEPLPKIDKDKPIWTSEYNGKNYLWAKIGNHFTSEFLLSLGMKESKTKGMFSMPYAKHIYDELIKQHDLGEVEDRPF